MAFDGLLANGSDAVRDTIVALPALLEHPVHECELALEEEGGALLVAIRAEGGASAEGIQRVRFWAVRAGGGSLVLAPGEAAEASWRARVRACARRRVCSRLDELPVAFDAVMGAAPSRGDDRIPARLRLRVDIGGPGSEGIAFNARDRLLFVPGHVSPPLGDELELHLSLGRAAELGRCWARVVRVRGAAARPGAPAGYVLQLGALAERVAAALVTSCASMNADAMVEEARRAAPRYPVQLAVRLRRLPSPGEPAATEGPDAPREDGAARVVSLSIGGAFVETPSAPPVGGRVEVRFRRNDESFTTTATVVYATSTGVGLKFRLSPPEEGALGRLIARISARPRRALVVDDDALARQMIGDALAELGYDVVTAPDGDRAMRILASELYALDAVVTDLRMEGLDGSQLVQALDSARDHVHVAIVVVSGRVEPEIVRRLTQAGADAVLGKGVAPEQIAATVDALVEAVRTELRRPLAAARAAGGGSGG